MAYYNTGDRGIFVGNHNKSVAGPDSFFTFMTTSTSTITEHWHVRFSGLFIEVFLICHLNSCILLSSPASDIRAEGITLVKYKFRRACDWFFFWALSSSCNRRSSSACRASLSSLLSVFFRNDVRICGALGFSRACGPARSVSLQHQGFVIPRKYFQCKTDVHSMGFILITNCECEPHV